MRFHASNIVRSCGELPLIGRQRCMHGGAPTFTWPFSLARQRAEGILCISPKGMGLAKPIIHGVASPGWGNIAFVDTVLVAIVDSVARPMALAAGGGGGGGVLAQAISAAYHFFNNRIPILRPSEPGHRVHTKWTNVVGAGVTDQYLATTRSPANRVGRSFMCLGVL